MPSQELETGTLLLFNRQQSAATETVLTVELKGIFLGLKDIFLALCYAVLG